MDPSKVFFTPSQRWVRPTLPCSWMTQTAFLAPSSFSRLPSASPATVSSWPKNSIRPSFFQSARPELSPTTGMPAFSALARTLRMASGLARVTAMPSTFWSIAFCTRLAWLPAFGSAE
ncbi:hypothetical protein SVIOM342S_01083 [Streptomyces violaceorubidus]